MEQQLPRRRHALPVTLNAPGSVWSNSHQILHCEARPEQNVTIKTMDIPFRFAVYDGQGARRERGANAENVTSLLRLESEARR